MEKLSKLLSFSEHKRFWLSLWFGILIYGLLLSINQVMAQTTTTTSINTTTTTIPNNSICRPCDTSLLSKNEPSQYFMIGMCLVANLLVCNPILFGMALIFVLIIGAILMFKARLFG